LPGSCGKQEKREYEKPGGDVGELGVIHTSDENALEGDQNDQAVTKDIVVQRSEKLCCEKRRKPPLAQQGKLARSRQWF
jgi:hypothetical protein